MYVIDMETPLSLEDMEAVIAALEVVTDGNRKLIKWSKENDNLEDFSKVLRNAKGMWSSLKDNAAGRLATISRVAKGVVARGLQGRNEIEKSQMQIELDMRPSQMVAKAGFMFKALRERVFESDSTATEDSALSFILSTLVGGDATAKGYALDYFAEGSQEMEDIMFFRNLIECFVERFEQAEESKRGEGSDAV